MTAALRLVAAAAIIAAVVIAATRGPRWLMGGGAPQGQRPLLSAARSPIGGNAVAHGHVRVVLVDELSRADTARVPAFDALCERGLDLVVDVGFPTKSLPTQLVLWTGLTADQLGAPTGNLAEGSPPPFSIAARVGGIAVVEAYRSIASAAAFTVEPDANADAANLRADPVVVRAWRAGGFEVAAQRAVASDARLVLVHILAVDEAAHLGGRSTPFYKSALGFANHVLTAATAAIPPDALMVVLADHGHLSGGGHGDAEDSVRHVRACAFPSPIEAAPQRAEVHLVDLSLLIASRLGVELDARAVGRALPAAIATPDPDATLPHPGAVRWAFALVLAALVLGLGARRFGTSSLAFGWPLGAYALECLASGLPTLSANPTLFPSMATAAPFLVLAVVSARHRGWDCVAITAIGPAVVAVVFGILSRVPDSIFTGVPPRMPWWTGHFIWSTHVLGMTALMVAGALALPRRGPIGSFLSTFAFRMGFRTMDRTADHMRSSSVRPVSM